jgi:6-phosphogluconolactonase
MPLHIHASARALALAAGATLAFGAGTAGAAPTSSGHNAGSRVVGHLYVNDNTATENTIAAYARHADGSLTPVPGSPFATGGAGTGSGIGSQGALQKADGGHLLLAVDAGSDQISVLRIGHSGALAPVAGSPVGSGGDEPVSIAVHGDRVFVANAGTDNNYAGFTLSPAGTLTPISGAVFTLPAGSDPGDVLINDTGTKLVGTRVGSSLIDSFVVGHHGQLRAAAGSPYAAQGPGPFGSEFSPTAPDQLFVSNAHGGTNAGTVSAFDDGPDGTLTSIPGGPFANNQTAPCWVTITRDGEFLFTVNTAVPSISSYSIGASGSLSLIANTPFPASDTPLGPEDARLTANQRALWVVDTAGDALSGFNVSGGTVTPMADGPIALPAGAHPFGIVTTS